jgi:ATP-binding protein involved in chromosome partitioning
MPITPEQVLAALRNVDDPDLKKDIVTLNMVQDVRVEGRKVAFTVVLTTPACPMKEMIQKACETAVLTLVDPSAELDITMTANTQNNPNAPAGMPGVRNMVLVASGKGGVGKSTVAANLALSLASLGAKVGLADADIYGPSVPTLFGLEGARPYLREVDGKNRMEPIEKYGIRLMSLGFMVPPGQAVVWRGPMASNALKQMFTDTDWGELDYLIVDLPPGTGDVHITITQQFPVSGAVVVTTPQQVALADVRKAINMFMAPAIQVPVLGVIENMSWFETPELPGRKFYLFGQGGGDLLCDEYGFNLLGQIPVVEEIRAGGDAGTPIALQPEYPQAQAFIALAQQVAQQTSIANARRQAMAARG